MSTERIRIDLTNDQQEQLRRECGHSVKAVELDVRELESRLAPYYVIKMTDAAVTSVQF